MDFWVWAALIVTNDEFTLFFIIILRVRELRARSTACFFPLLFNSFGRAIRKMHCVSVWRLAVTIYSNFQCTREHKVYEMGFGHCVKMWRKKWKKKEFLFAHKQIRLWVCMFNGKLLFNSPLSIVISLQERRTLWEK